MTANESNAAFAETATHDSRNILSDCLLETGHIDLTRPHVPLLFVGAEDDEIIPAQLCVKNAAAYKDVGSMANYVEFPKRGHFICGDPKWK
ncbi:hypothetical protein [Fimbriiglobus ruber]|uniref:Peptidase S9 prolyl oligopeptidase catalytic domain-containing protein n=1 Tax=Fimbriiglobus ruber TaxID=1908690 RepID=A0A225DTZ7_9BACT|nr:hypothetical protein [Fimbriiglobus ruber]OWK39845.1 hypothetical protein FRUB_05735 [Fimbriiglobus ruber]